MNAAFANLVAEEEAKMNDKIHFKLTHGGVTRRFALSRSADDLISNLKARVLTITGTADVSLYWKDEDSLIVLETDDDMHAAVDYAETQNKLGCVALETGEKEEVKGEEEMGDIRIVTERESKAAFNGFAFMCDACNGYLGPLNGGRFMCTICDNYDLCALCLLKGEHSNHAFVRLLNGETELPLTNEARGVLSMFTKDVPRCTPTFTVAAPARSSDASKMLAANADWIAKELANTASIDELFKSIDEKYKQEPSKFLKNFEEDMRKGIEDILQYETVDTPTIHTDVKTDKPTEQKDQKLEYSRDDMFNIKEDMMMLCLNAQLEKPTSNSDDLNFVQELLKKSEELVDLLELEDGGIVPATPVPEQPVEVAAPVIAASELPPPSKKMKPLHEQQLQPQPQLQQQPLMQQNPQIQPAPQLQQQSLEQQLVIEALKQSQAQPQPPTLISGAQLYPQLYPTVQSQPAPKWMQPQQPQPQLQPPQIVQQQFHLNSLPSQLQPQPQLTSFPSQLHQQPVPQVQPPKWMQHQMHPQPQPQVQPIQVPKWMQPVQNPAMQQHPHLTTFPAQLQPQPMQPPTWMQPQLTSFPQQLTQSNLTNQLANNALLQELSKRYDVVVSTRPPIVLGPFTPEGLPYPIPTAQPTAQKIFNEPKKEETPILRNEKEYNAGDDPDGFRKAVRAETMRRAASERRDRDADYRDGDYSRRDTSERRGYGNDYVKRDFDARPVSREFGSGRDGRKFDRDSTERRDRVYVNSDYARRRGGEYGNDYVKRDFGARRGDAERSSIRFAALQEGEFDDRASRPFGNGRGYFDDRYSRDYTQVDPYEQRRGREEVGSNRAEYGEYYTGEELRGRDQREANRNRGVFSPYDENERNERRERGFGEGRRVNYQWDSDCDDWEPEEEPEKPKKSAFTCSLRESDETRTEKFNRLEKEKNAAYMKASQIPAHMVMQVLEEFVKLNVEKIVEKLDEHINMVELNTYFLKEHPVIFVDDHYDDDFLIGNVAVDLVKHLRRIRVIARKETDFHRHFDAAYDLLRKALNDNGTNTESYAETARKLRSILLTMDYHGEPDHEWGCQFDSFVGFMEADHRRGYYEPPPRVPSACPEREGMFAPRPREGRHSLVTIHKLPEHFPN